MYQKLGRVLALAAVVCAPLSLAPAAGAVPLQHAAVAKKDYVSLGDSYSVGQFLPDLVTTDDYCGQSTSSYPRQLARDPQFSAVYDHVRDVTCGGATIDNNFGGVLRPQTGFGGPPVPVPDDAPEKPAQIEALNTDTDLVTVGIGANTYLISEVGLDCARRGALAWGQGTPCTDHYRTDGLSDLRQRTERLQQQFDEMMPRLHERAPHATFVFVGYPTIFPADGSHCQFGNPFQGATLAPGDMAFLARQMDHINHIMKTTVEKYGDTYVDTATPSRGHDFCRSGSDKWMFGAFGNGVGENDRPVPTTLFHPNAAGAANQTAQVTQAVKNLGLLD
ncbi:SGNH/GDSL hydrolase family protein [Streptomyces brevispora]|uniref:SGNH/GDSL hydrolase family protein n=1 Tax=Streptomyces brevispora TaxID=887462 RepID=UPI003715723B